MASGSATGNIQSSFFQKPPYYKLNTFQIIIAYGELSILTVYYIISLQKENNKNTL
jgi:hypothetical protein